MIVATLNVNSIRMRLDAVLEWLAENEPDVLALQETKVPDDKFPLAEFEELGWQVAIHGQKSYNGVALVSRHPIANVRTGFGDPLFPEDCRLLAAEIEGVTILNTYVPNGTAVGTDKFAYKLAWLDRFLVYLRAHVDPGAPAVWLGDMNIAPTQDDVWGSPKHEGKIGRHKEELARLEALLAWGWTDLFRKFTQGPGHYTFWDYVIPRSFENNLGWRIDHIYGTAPVASACSRCEIDPSLRQAPKPSDHTAVVAELNPAL